jgi:adenylosuccinate synthase
MIDIVMGAGAGDEGKGLTVARLASTKKSTETIVVLNNGGAQRGHSVIFNGKEHIFKHFGSATPLGIASYFGPDYLIDPIQFVKEFNEISHLYGCPISFRSYKCKFVTPWDIMTNQILQKKKWTGSCGMGIWETILRYNSFLSFDFNTFCLSLKEDQIRYLKSIRDGYYKSLRFIDIPDSYYNSWFSPNLIEHFINDCMFTFNNCHPFNENIIKAYPNIIIENGQGLLLNDTGTNDVEATPSKTGIETAKFLFDDSIKNDEINLHFVTRPYLTRHGSNEFLNKDIDCDLKKDVEINQYNEWQRDLLYDNLNLHNLKNSLNKEASKLDKKKYIIHVTHCDELDREHDFNKVFNKQEIHFYDKNQI